MGARDEFTTPVRGMSQEAAMAYLGVKRRTFESLRHRLRPVPLGTSLVYDVRELDELFDSLKAEALLATGDAQAGRQLATAPATSRGTPVSAPSPTHPAQKGTRNWVSNVASIRTEMERGESTASTAVSAFNAVSELIKKQKRG